MFSLVGNEMKRTFLSHNLNSGPFPFPPVAFSNSSDSQFSILKRMASRTLIRAVRPSMLTRQATSITPVARRSITQFASRRIAPQTGIKVHPLSEDPILIIGRCSVYADSGSQDSGLCGDKGGSL